MRVAFLTQIIIITIIKNKAPWFLMKNPIYLICLLTALVALDINSMGTSKVLPEDELNVYSARKEHLIKPLLDRFSETTNVKINLVTAKGDALLARLKAEGVNSPADIFLTVDAGRLHRAQQMGVFQPVRSEILQQTIPSHLRSPTKEWFGLSIRARVIIYAKDRVTPDQLDTYESLSSSEWKDRICIRSSENIYNQSLVASMLATRGPSETEEWLKAFTNNFARQPSGGDRDQIKAVSAGQCDVAIVNSYYLAGMLRSRDARERDAANQVALHWPNQEDRGTHINISGAGVTKSSKNPELAARLLEFLTTIDSQQWYAEVNNEYPIIPEADIHEVLQKWGAFKADQLNMTLLGLHNSDAILAMDRAGWE